tara:strand:- start:11085 stop:12212 length:1128 start_codon:yes stop_codon:yes gene_type:complete
MNGMAGGFINKKPREIRLKYQGTDIPAEQIFQTMYQDLEPLVDSNVSFQNMGSSRRYRAMRDGRSGHKSDPSERLISDWTKTLPEVGEFQADVTFDDGTTTTYDIGERKNFDKGILKLPSIVYLVSEDGTQVILREARRYPLDGIVKKQAIKHFGNRFDIKASDQYEKSDELVTEEDERQAETDLLIPSKDNQVMYVPEPQLLLALEQIYQDFDGNISRLTPEMAIVDSQEDKLWFVREYLPDMMNSQFSTEKVGQYIGTLHALGLMEIMDRQLIHYCLFKQGLVNYDPDFMTHTRNTIMLTQRDTESFLQELKSNNHQGAIHLEDEDFKDMRKRASRLMEELDQKGINRKTIYDYLSKSIDIESVPFIPNLKQD